MSLVGRKSHTRDTLFHALIACVVLIGVRATFDVTASAAEPRKLVIVAGKPSHPPRMHEFQAGTKLLAKCLSGRDDLRVETVFNGWPEQESVFDGAAAIVFYMDAAAVTSW